MSERAVFVVASMLFDWSENAVTGKVSDAVAVQNVRGNVRERRYHAGAISAPKGLQWLADSRCDAVAFQLGISVMHNVNNFSGIFRFLDLLKETVKPGRIVFGKVKTCRTFTEELFIKIQRVRIFGEFPRPRFGEHFFDLFFRVDF